MDNLVRLIKQPDGVWTSDVDGILRTVVLDESSLIVWRALGLHPSGVVEVTQSSNGNIEKFTALQTGEDLKYLVFNRNHALYRSMNLRNQYKASEVC